MKLSVFGIAFKTLTATIIHIIPNTIPTAKPRNLFIELINGRDAILLRIFNTNFIKNLTDMYITTDDTKYIIADEHLSIITLSDTFSAKKFPIDIPKEDEAIVPIMLEPKRAIITKLAARDTIEYTDLTNPFLYPLIAKNKRAVMIQISAIILTSGISGLHLEFLQHYRLQRMRNYSYHIVLLF